MAEALHGFVADTIETELPSELRYLANYDKARRSMAEVVDLPNRPADLFVRLVRENGGSLSRNKRKQIPEFRQLSSEEIEDLEKAVGRAFAE